MSGVFIELPKFNPQVIKTKIDKWLAFLRAGPKVKLTENLMRGNRRDLLLRAYWMVNHMTKDESGKLFEYQKALRDSLSIVAHALDKGIIKGDARATKREQAKARADRAKDQAKAQRDLQEQKLQIARKLKDIRYSYCYNCS